jgi:hypothetical protein
MFYRASTPNPQPTSPPSNNQPTNHNQRECGVRPALRVVPLFETLDDLHNAPATMRTLFSSEWYLSHIDGMQECMIGYSDSGKDAGRMAAAWALFETQERIVQVRMRFFRRGGGGGSVLYILNCSTSVDVLCAQPLAQTVNHITTKPSNRSPTTLACAWSCSTAAVARSAAAAGRRTWRSARSRRARSAGACA